VSVRTERYVWLHDRGRDVSQLVPSVSSATQGLHTQVALPEVRPLEGVGLVLFVGILGTVPGGGAVREQDRVTHLPALNLFGSALGLAPLLLGPLASPLGRPGLGDSLREAVVCADREES